MLIKDLTESYERLLFHYTHIPEALDIITQGKFKLSTWMGTDSEIKMSKERGGDRWYYLSVSRERASEYGRRKTWYDGVMFNLKEDWLSARYKIVPIDYWERVWIKSHGMKRSQDDWTTVSEAEDRILSRKHVMIFPPNISDLIESIHVFYDPIRDDSNRFGHFFRKFFIRAKLLGIQTYFYTNKNAYLLQDTRRTSSVSDILDKLKGGPSFPGSQLKKYDYFLPYKELFYKTKRKDLSNDASRRLYYMKHGNLGFDSDVGTIKNHLHNDKNKYAFEFLDMMKQARCKTIEEFIEYLINKWKSIDEN